MNRSYFYSIKIRRNPKTQPFFHPSGAISKSIFSGWEGQDFISPQKIVKGKKFSAKIF